MHPRIRYYGGMLVRFKMRRLASKFFANTPNCESVQQRVLFELLKLNAGTRFAADHRLDAVRTIADFRKQVPITDYEYHRPYIEDVKNGNLRALLGERNKLLMFALTSGTTANTKFIPITSRFLDDYRNGWKIWGIRAYDAHPTLHLQDICQLSSDYDQFRTPGGTPCGNISGLVSAIQSPIVKTMYTIPYIVAKIAQPEAKYYAALRLSIANARVGMVMTANPSTLIHLAKLGDTHRESLIRDIHDGTLSTKMEIAEDVRKQLGSSVRRKNPARAKDLEAMVARTGHLFPRDYWADSSLLAVWTGGSAAAYLDGLREFYGDIPVRDHGLSASEGRMTIPFADRSSAGILDIGSHFFEFVPEEEMESDRPTVLSAHELKPDRNYYILLTTASGLCRYNIRDVVRCTGFEGTTPTLEFLNKGAHISSLTGEKITESQVVTAVREALQEVGARVSFFTVAPQWGDPPGYRLLVERHELASDDVANRLAQAADARLQKINCEYGEKRQTGRLRPLTLLPLSQGTWQRFAQQRQSRLGGSIEQYKHPCLSPDLKFCDNLVQNFSQPTQKPNESAA